MCEPTTIAAGVSLAVGAYGASQQTSAARSEQKYNAAMAQRVIESERKQAEQAIEGVQRNAAQTRGRQQAALAANGLDVSSGSALSLQEDTNFFAAEDAKTIAKNSANNEYDTLLALGESNRASQGRVTQAKTALAGQAIGYGGQVAGRWFAGGAGGGRDTRGGF